MAEKTGLNKVPLKPAHLQQDGENASEELQAA